MEKDILVRMPPAQRVRYEVSRREALGITAKFGLDGAAAALGAGVGTTSVRETLAAAGLPKKTTKLRSTTMPRTISLAVPA